MKYFILVGMVQHDKHVGTKYLQKFKVVAEFLLLEIGVEEDTTLGVVDEI